MKTPLIVSRNKSVDKNADALRAILYSIWDDFVLDEEIADGSMEGLVSSVDTLIVNLLITSEMLSNDLIVSASDNIKLQVELDKADRQLDKLSNVAWDDDLDAATQELAMTLSNMPSATYKQNANGEVEHINVSIDTSDLRVLLRESISEWINRRLR
jgi:hypothetical protein